MSNAQTIEERLTAVEKEIRQGFEQVFSAETEVLPGIAPVANRLH